jgi:hypothetical protein
MWGFIPRLGEWVLKVVRREERRSVELKVDADAVRKFGPPPPDPKEPQR